MEREEACDWYPTPHLRMCLGILQQQWRRVLVDYRSYNGSSRPLRCQSAETEWRDVRQATEEEIAEVKAEAAQETLPLPPTPAGGHPIAYCAGETPAAHKHEHEFTVEALGAPAKCWCGVLARDVAETGVCNCPPGRTTAHLPECPTLNR